jgi:hypothetical protein
MARAPITDMDTFIAGMKSALEAEPHERASLFRLVIVADILHTRLTALEERMREYEARPVPWWFRG